MVVVLGKYQYRVIKALYRVIKAPEIGLKLAD